MIDYCYLLKKDKNAVGHQWLMPVILATLEAEIRRITVRSHPYSHNS
jgi:hypothetical protein